MLANILLPDGGRLPLPLCLQVGRMLQSTLVEGSRQKCGYAAVADLATGQQETLYLSVSHPDLFPPFCAASAISITACVC